MTGHKRGLAMVFFDLDGTLLRNPEHFPSVFGPILEEHGLTKG